MNTHEFAISEKDVIEFKKRRHVRALTQQAIRRGQLVKPACCQLCAQHRSDLNAHHIDYGRPLDITWLCDRCHGVAHRKNHPLNPRNNHQSTMPLVFEKYQTVNVAFSVPVKTFLAIRDRAKKTGKPISKLLREQAQRQFPILKEQLEFDFMEQYDESQNESHPRVQSMAANERMHRQPKLADISKVRRRRDLNMHGMEELFPFFERHGQNAI